MRKEESGGERSPAHCWAVCFGMTLCLLQYYTLLRCVSWDDPLFSTVLRLRARALCALGQHCTTKLHPQPFGFIFKAVNSLYLELPLVEAGHSGTPSTLKAET